MEISVLFVVKLESGGWYELAGGKSAVEFNGFGKYSMPILRPPNIETSEPEIKNISDKYQDKDNFILKNIISDVKWNLIPDKI